MWKITLEQVITSVVEKKENLYDQNFDGEANWWDVVNFPCMQMSLVMSLRFIFGDDWNDAPRSPRFFFNVISLESRPLIFVYLHTRTQKSSNVI